MAKGMKYDQQFKENAVRYRLDHPELTLKKAAENLGISDSALKTWLRTAKEHEAVCQQEDLEIIPAMSERDRTSPKRAKGYKGCP